MHISLCKKLSEEFYLHCLDKRLSGFFKAAIYDRRDDFEAKTYSLNNCCNFTLVYMEADFPIRKKKNKKSQQPWTSHQFVIFNKMPIIEKQKFYQALSW